jgi:polysaccharide pyruvyl transferase WcaK-like protein
MEVAGQLVTYVDFDLNTRSIRALIDGSSLVITSRFHAMVAGLALGIPTMVIGWSHKYDEVLESFGSSDYAIDFSEADERLIPMAFDLLENGDEVRRKISTVLPGVIEASRAQFEVVNELSASS